MQPIEKITIDLPINFIVAMDEAVAAGHYPSRNDILIGALLQWQLEYKQPLQNVEELRALCDEGLASGIAKPFTIEKLLDELRQKHASK